MLFSEVPQAPDIPALNQRQQMQRSHRLPIPVKIWQYQKPKIRVTILSLISKNDIFLFCPTFENVKHPV